jgi:hypothetical protein
MLLSSHEQTLIVAPESAAHVFGLLFVWGVADKILSTCLKRFGFK